MRTLIAFILVLVATQATIAADKKKQKAIADLLQYQLPVDTPSLTWTEQPPLLFVHGLSGERPFNATIHERLSKVLEIVSGDKFYYRWSGIKVVGHRATMLLAPENTVAAIRRASQIGVDIMELDVRQTKDGHFVIMHDPSVDRTTTGSGNVSDLTIAQIKTFDAGIKYSTDFKGETVPTLAEALRAMKETGTAPDIDFKSGDLRRLRKILSEAGFAPDQHISFFGSGSEAKEVKSWGLLIRPPSPLGAITLGSVINNLNPQIINISELQHSQSYVSNIHKRGIRSFVNVILNRSNEEERLRSVVATLPDYIQTDRPDYLVPYLRSLGLHD